MRHSKIADGRPLSGEERSCSGHHRHDRVYPWHSRILGDVRLQSAKLVKVDIDRLDKRTALFREAARQAPLGQQIAAIIVMEFAA
jgi:hypothetical protein